MIVFFWVPFLQVLPYLIRHGGSVVHVGLVSAVIAAVAFVKIVTDDTK